MPVSTPATQTGQVAHAAAGASTAPLLAGPERAGEVVAATSELVAVRLPGASPADRPDLICLTSHDAVRLPCAMVVAAPLPRARVGDPASVGGGRLRLPDTVVTVARWRPAPLLPASDPVICAERAAQCPAPELEPGLLDVAATFACALRSPALLLDDTVGALLGLGPGLTPTGDDVLTGALVALRSVRSVMTGRLAAAIDAADPPARTTAVSAGLLAHATRGLCVPQLATFVAALGSRGAHLSSARRSLLAVGHTSGAGLYTGVLCALAGPGSLAPERRPI